jgi:hypothetical protein
MTGGPGRSETSPTPNSRNGWRDYRRRDRVASLTLGGLKAGALEPHDVPPCSRLFLPARVTQTPWLCAIAIHAGAGARAAALVSSLLLFPVSAQKRLGFASGWWLRALALQHLGVTGVW